MATLASELRPVRTDHRFFFVTAIAMLAIVVLGFGMQWAMGRSTFSAPPMLHVHGLVFLSWTILYVVQTGLVARGSVALHKRLAGWVRCWQPRWCRSAS